MEFFSECHGHIMMNGVDLKSAISTHKNGINVQEIRKNLQLLKNSKVSFFRDGGDNLGVSKYAKSISCEYDIDYLTPIFAIHKKDYYGSIVGKAYSTLADYRKLIAQAKREGCDFIKLMLSGIVCFDDAKPLSCPALLESEIIELVNIAHGEGFKIMAHVNGADAIKSALIASVDSIEHGYFMDEECLQILAQSSSVWVPTLIATSAFLGRAGYEQRVVENVVKNHSKTIKKALILGASIAIGSDSGAVGVPHGEGMHSEYQLISNAVSSQLIKELDCTIEKSNKKIMREFSLQTS